VSKQPNEANLPGITQDELDWYSVVICQTAVNAGSVVHSPAAYVPWQDQIAAQPGPVRKALAKQIRGYIDRYESCLPGITPAELKEYHHRVYTMSFQARLIPEHHPGREWQTCIMEAPEEQRLRVARRLRREIDRRLAKLGKHTNRVCTDYDAYREWAKEYHPMMGFPLTWLNELGLRAYELLKEELGRAPYQRYMSAEGLRLKFARHYMTGRGSKRYEVELDHNLVLVTRDKVVDMGLDCVVELKESKYTTRQKISWEMTPEQRRQAVEQAEKTQFYGLFIS
jgi:hypothetical protein